MRSGRVGRREEMRGRGFCFVGWEGGGGEEGMVDLIDADAWMRVCMYGWRRKCLVLYCTDGYELAYRAMQWPWGWASQVEFGILHQEFL